MFLFAQAAARPYPELPLTYLMKSLTLFAVALGLSFVSAANTFADSRPNFLLIIADDSTWNDFGFAGNTDVQTPHLDELRSQGLYLDHMFSPASTCSPSRHALYSGLHSVRSGAYPNHTRYYDGTKSLFSYLKEIGYRVALQNKSHVGPAASFPYETIKGADDLTKTEEFLKRKADQPWLLSYASSDPHTDWTRGPSYNPNELTLPSYLHDNATTRALRAKYYGEITKLDEQVGNLLRLLKDTNQADNTLVMFVSEQGSAFPFGGKWSLYDNGIRVSTLVRWPGKVKPGTSSKALTSYVDVVPTLLEAAGIDPLKTNTGCPDMTGKTGFDGSSFLNVLLGKTDKHHQVVFSQHTTVGINGYLEAYPIRAARDPRYKLIRNLAPENTYQIHGIHLVEPFLSWKVDAKDDPTLAKRVDWQYHRPAVELYDTHYDPLEMNNLADDEAYAAIKGRLLEQLGSWMKQQGDAGLATELKAHERQDKRRRNRKAKANRS